MSYYSLAAAGAVPAGLPDDSLFTLQAILQHGGLAEAEHAPLFQLMELESQTPLDALFAAGWIEREPELSLRIAAHATREVESELAGGNLV